MTFHVQKRLDNSNGWSDIPSKKEAKKLEGIKKVGKKGRKKIGTKEREKKGGGGEGGRRKVKSQNPRKEREKE